MEFLILNDRCHLSSSYWQAPCLSSPSRELQSTSISCPGFHSCCPGNSLEGLVLEVTTYKLLHTPVFLRKHMELLSGMEAGGSSICALLLPHSSLVVSPRKEGIPFVWHHNLCSYCPGLTLPCLALMASGAYAGRS